MRLKYKVYKNNQLSIVRDKKLLQPHGKFFIDNNRLIYEVTETKSWRQEHDIPKRIILEGKWIVDKDLDLGFALRKTQTQAGGEKLVLKTEIVKVKPNSLIFSLATQGKSGTYTVRLLQLKGRWQADKYNRLQFLIKRAKSQYDTLTFQGIWDLRHNSIVYTYRKTILTKKKKQTHSLRFKGYWQINKKNRLTYILDLKNNSYFDFKVYLQTPNIIGKRGVIKYRIGIGVKKSPSFRDKTISLYGVWKFSRKTGLSLILDYIDGGIGAINFGVFLRLKEKKKVALGLRSREGKDLGISVTFTQRFLKNNANWFLRAVKEEEHPRFEWGIKIPW